MEARLGDDVDDFCVKCKRLTNHVVVSLMNDGPAKVRCRTCHGDHDYRHEQAPPPKVDPRKAALLKAQASSTIVPSPVVAVDGTVDGILDVTMGDVTVGDGAAGAALEETLETSSVGVGATSSAVEGMATDPSRVPAKVKRAGRAQAH